MKRHWETDWDIMDPEHHHYKWYFYTFFGALIFVLRNLYSCWRDKFCEYDLPTVKISWNSKGLKKFRG